MIRIQFFKNAKSIASTLLLKKTQPLSNILYKSTVSRNKYSEGAKSFNKPYKEVFFPPGKVLQIKDKVALVTGATEGIGLRCVKELLRYGAKGVMIADSNTALGAKLVMELSKTYGPEKIAFIEICPANYNMLKNAFSSTIDLYKSLDIVINNVTFIEKKWEDQIDESIKGIVLSTKLCLKFMGRQNGGKGGILVNVTSDSKEDSKSLPLFMAVEDFIIRFDRCVASTYFDTSNVKVLTICKASFENVASELTTVLSKGMNGFVWMPK